MNFIIDHREKDLKIIFPKANFQNLDLGDIKFLYEDKVFLLIERKTFKDLIASIDDGRYRNQKKRLLESGIEKNRILYLLEGNMDDVPGKMKTVFGMIINTLYRDKIPVIKMNSLEETIYFLNRIKEKLENNDPGILKNFMFDCAQDGGEHLEYLSTIKQKKKDNLTPLNCSILQLAQIPGVSITSSNIILEKYKSLNGLILAFHEIEKEKRELMLSNIEINTSTGKIRKLGNILSKRIYMYLTNES